MSTHERKLARPMPALPADWLPPGPVAYLDIETTGLAPDRAQVTLAGLVYGEGGDRHLEQYFVDHPAEEGAVLRAVARRLRQFTGVVTYNGDRFDLPFLRGRAQHHRVPWPRVRSLDLLRVAFDWKQAYGLLPNCKLQTVMAHFQVGRTDHTGGYEMVEAYERWLRIGNPAERELILEHNADDLLLLPDLVPHLSSPPRGRITTRG